MSANVENMMYVGEKPWHGLGVEVKEAPTSDEAIKLAGLDWDVVPKPIYDEFGRKISGYKVNMRSSDNTALGIVTDRYTIVQNKEAFAFTDELIGNGAKYETAGSLASGKRVWLLARLEDRTMAEEDMENYLVFTNAHDGTGAVRVACTSVRVVCQNTLNLALSQAKRHWSCVHKGDIRGKLEEARYTLASAERYMQALEEEFGELKLKKVTDQQVKDMTERLLQIEFNNLYNKAVKTGNIISLKERIRQQKYEDKLSTKRNEILSIYYDKPDLVGTDFSAFRFINAVSDYATHTTDHKNTKNYQENLFMKVVDGHSMIDNAYQLALAV